MQFFVQHSELRDLYDKVVAGQRISEADALRLFESKDLNAVGAIADLVRQRKVSRHASYIICLLYTSPSPRDGLLSRMPSSA